MAHTVSKEECIAYIIQITVQDMKGELGDGNGMDGSVLLNDEDGELEEDEEDEEDAMDL
jgi:hypothetical protein